MCDALLPCPDSLNISDTPWSFRNILIPFEIIQTKHVGFRCNLLLCRIFVCDHLTSKSSSSRFVVLQQSMQVCTKRNSTPKYLRVSCVHQKIQLPPPGIRIFPADFTKWFSSINNRGANYIVFLQYGFK